MFGIQEMIVCLMVVLIVNVVPFISALVDILKSEFEGNKKLIWLLTVIFVPLIGPIVYFIIGRKQKIRR